MDVYLKKQKDSINIKEVIINNVNIGQIKSNSDQSFWMFRFFFDIPWRGSYNNEKEAIKGLICFMYMIREKINETGIDLNIYENLLHGKEVIFIDEVYNEKANN